MSRKKIINNKVLTFVLLVGIASTGFAGISSANSGQTLSEKSSGMQQGVKKMFADRGHFGKRKGFGNLTDEEKTALASMSDDEKKAFFEAKKQEMIAQKEAGKAVIDKLIAGESLTADEESMRLEMLAKIEDGDHKRDNADIIAKILAGDELTVDEEVQLADMQEKHAQRKAQREAIQSIMEKIENGEEVTEDEQAILDEHKQARGERRGKEQR